MSILIKGTNIEDLQRAMLMFRGHEIVEISDHGDLIDQKELMRGFADFVRASNNSDFAEVPTWNDAVFLVGSAPVVIPRDVKVCPLYSDDEVTEYCVEGPCTDEMEGRCPIAERNEDPSHPFADSVMMAERSEE